MDRIIKENMKNKLRILFKNEIYKDLPLYENKRKKTAIMQILVAQPIIFVCLMICSSFIHFPFRENLMSFSFLGLIISIILLSILPQFLGYKTDKDGVLRIEQDLEKILKQKFMKELLEIFLKDVKCGKNIDDIYENAVEQYGYSEKVINIATLFKFQKELRELNIFNSFPFVICDDCIAGTYDNVKIKIYEASTKPTSFLGTIILIFIFLMLSCMYFPSMLLLIFIFPPFILLIIWLTYKLIKGALRYSAFRGLIIEFDFDKNFTNETFFLERSTAARKIKPNKKIYKEVKIESIYFEKQYQLFSNNQLEARYIFTPTFIEKINKIRDIFKTNKIRGSFKNKKLTLTINTNRDMFALGNDFKETNYKTLITFYNEMISLLQLVEELKRYLK